MWKWLPWKYLIRKAARTRGFVDPLAVMARVQRFAQPSEVAAPLELLRAGVVFHARGLMNTSVIQHNLDWVWPYWVERQFDPLDVAFIPRAFSLTHINLTHRNWTAVGVPDSDRYPIVDPRGLLTPFWDGWSLDAWVIADDGRQLLPSHLKEAIQHLSLDRGLAVATEASLGAMQLASRVDVEAIDGLTVCRQFLSARGDAPGWLVVALRPYNPEGVSFVHEISLSPDRRAWRVEGKATVEFGEPIERNAVSNYKNSDVHARLVSGDELTEGRCDVGMLTAAAMFRIEPGRARELAIRVPLNLDDDEVPTAPKRSGFPTWDQALAGAATAVLPDPHMQFLYDAAVRSLILHSPGDVFPGPYTYKRFWFRDAAFILHALCCVGLAERAAPVLEKFPSRQTRDGYFRSQDGEWDSNGEALWIFDRYCRLTGEPPPTHWHTAITRGAHWIARKRLRDDLPEFHAGLLPAGFSAEHLGHNDYYYWDDFWGVAGLRSAVRLLTELGDDSRARVLTGEAERFMAAIDRSLERSAAYRSTQAIPASPHRRMDAGAIGSLAVGYPLGLWVADDGRLLATVEFLLANCFVDGGFFQDMIHSGINAYLTLHVAQVLLRAGDARCFDLVKSVAELASPTGQWPEAIHPRTKGGCMGDGHHVWASAEWVQMIRNMFVREESERLVLASGIPSAWFAGSHRIAFGPAPTPYGPVMIEIDPSPDATTVRWRGEWRGVAPSIEIRPLGGHSVQPEPGTNEAILPHRVEV